MFLNTIPSSCRNAIIKMFAFGFFCDFVFFYPFYNVMFKDFGSSPLVMSLLLVTMQISKMLFDVPGGIISDFYSRRVMLIFSQVLRCLMVAMWSFFPCKATFFIGMAMWGISMSGIYGNLESYIYDLLKNYKSEDVFAKVMGVYFSIQSVAIGFGSLLGLSLFTLGKHKIVLSASGICILVGVVFGLLLPSYTITQKNGATKRGLKSFIDSAKATLLNKNVAFYIMLAVVQDGTFMFLIDMNTTSMIHLGFTNKTIPLIVSSVGIIKIFANLISGYVANYFTPKVILIINTAIYTMAVIFSINYSPGLVVAISLAMIMFSFFDVAVKSQVQRFIPSEVRATVMSGSGIFVSIAIISLNLINGGASDLAGAPKFGAIVTFSLLTLTSACLLFFENYKTKKQ